VGQQREPAADGKRFSRGSEVYLRWLFAVTFTFTGMMHFIVPAVYEAVMPPYLPFPRLLVLVSGLCEIAGAIGVLLPQPWRKWAGAGMVALLIAVFPANIEIARHGATFPNGAVITPFWGWVRLPFQLFFIWWAIVVSRDRQAG
jgi:uncharacterized membrane protein